MFWSFDQPTDMKQDNSFEIGCWTLVGSRARGMYSFKKRLGSLEQKMQGNKSFCCRFENILPHMWGQEL